MSAKLTIRNFEKSWRVSQKIGRLTSMWHISVNFWPKHLFYQSKCVKWSVEQICWESKVLWCLYQGVTRLRRRFTSRNLNFEIEKRWKYIFTLQNNNFRRKWKIVLENKMSLLGGHVTWKLAILKHITILFNRAKVCAVFLYTR